MFNIGVPSKKSSMTKIGLTDGHGIPFYFYAGIGQPINVTATGIDDFAQKIWSVEIMSLEFHNPRGDFEKWVRTLGNENLARQLGNLSREKPQCEVLRRRLIEIVKGKNRPPKKPAAKMS